ncbi:hypothetical protein IWQ60_011746 [Tieghemiomyces parasiticus]|uniref:Rab-GAP TBC domain-containing protein n=1 Tax=Tieghemiomyces parasiticus TaxID=78921 RepID=A0A9W7ZRD7_9FUNG|nr:hypothetical protein IWQ60_011746 [Tieghemiomyces parasiticus]
MTSVPAPVADQPGPTAAATPNATQLRFDHYGFLATEYTPAAHPQDGRDDDSDTFSVFLSPGFSKKLHSEEFRVRKWTEYLNRKAPKAVRTSKTARKLVTYGIPTQLRTRVWRFFAEESLIRTPGAFQELQTRDRIPIYDVIERDIPRCYPDHQMFLEEGSAGQQHLDTVLKAYAHYNPEVGYCQGMGRLVGVYLMQHMSPEDSFWLLAATIRSYLPTYYVPTLTQVRIDSAVFDRLLFEHNRKLADHLATHDITPLMYATSWFMTLFTMALPWASVLRVWDWFYLKGTKILFRIGLAILDCAADHLLAHCPTSSEILPFLLHIPHDLLAPEPLFAAANRVHITTGHLEKLTHQVTAHGIPDRGEIELGSVRSAKEKGRRARFRPLRKVFHS